MNKRDLVRQFITENPKLKSKKEAGKQLAKKYPDKFKDAEAARHYIRGVTGSAGEVHRRLVDPEKTKFFYSGFEKWAEENLNTEPAPWDEPFIIPTSIKELNIIADLHSVHLDYKVFQKFLKATSNKEALLINGDLVDSESLTRHLKGPSAISYESEIETCYKILEGLKQEFNHVYFKEGNHDFWLERYLLNNARDIFKVKGFSLKEILKLGELGVHHIHNLKYISYGDLHIVHGHEFPGFGMGKFPANGLVDKWQTFIHSYTVKILCSHSHRADHRISQKSKTGEFGEAWVTPAMCRKGAQYAPYSGWDNGWAVARQTEKGTEVDLVVV